MTAQIFDLDQVLARRFATSTAAVSNSLHPTPLRNGLSNALANAFANAFANAPFNTLPTPPPTPRGQIRDSPEAETRFSATSTEKT